MHPTPRPTHTYALQCMQSPHRSLIKTGNRSPSPDPEEKQAPKTLPASLWVCRVLWVLFGRSRGAFANRSITTSGFRVPIPMTAPPHAALFSLSDPI